MATCDTPHLVPDPNAKRVYSETSTTEGATDLYLDIRCYSA
jgi:hypothetical protein